MLPWLVAIVFSPGVGPFAQTAEPFEPFAGFRVLPAGDMRFEQVHMSIVHFSPAWRCSRQGQRNVIGIEHPAKEPGRWGAEGQFRPVEADEAFDFSQKIVAEGSRQLSYTVRLRAEKGIPGNTLALAVRVPVQDYDGKAIIVDETPVSLQPETFEGATIHKHVKRLAVPTARGHLSIMGDFELLIQDGRGTAHPFYRFRVMFSPSRGAIKDASLTVKIALEQPDVTPLDLRSAANMGFRDDKDGDRKGGWTDQGENDIRMLKPGLRQFGSIPFHIANPRANRGRSCIVLAGPQREYFPSQATVDVTGGPLHTLYLLHATAWTPAAGTHIGDVVATYDDGSHSSYSVVSGEDVGNWFRAVDLQNGIVVWSGANSRSPIGLYLTKIPLEARTLARLEFRSAGNAVWMIVAASAGENAPIWVPRRNDYIYPDDQWHPFSHHAMTAPGTILDFSHLLDAPAGKDGPIVNRDGHFEPQNRPGRRMRFFGTNICHLANFQEKDAAERLADELARKGYNSARLHHFGAQLPHKDGTNSTQFDPQQLDRLDYLFHCLKQRGIYVSIDLYTTRTVRKGEIPEIDRSVRLNEFKALMAVSPAAMQNWKTYARNLLTHRNPYTGLAWKDDPALFSICLVNEGALYVHWDCAPDIAPLYVARYKGWLAERGVNIEDAPVATSVPWLQFIIDLNRTLTRECREHVRGLGTTALITDMNYRQVLPSYLLREDLDYVDNHVYWDLKKFLGGRKWKLPYGFRQLSDTLQSASTPRRAMPTRRFGKPFLVTEFNYCYPNHFRAEGGPLMAAYAALQDWDGIYRYSYSHSPARTQEPTSVYYLDNVSDPINVLADRIGSLLFLREDVSPARTRIQYLYSEGMLGSEGMLSPSTGRAGENVSRLGLIYRIGCVNPVREGTFPPPAGSFAVASRSAWAMAMGSRTIFPESPDLLDTLSTRGLIPVSPSDLLAGTVQSETGQLRLNAPEGLFTVVTPRTECFVLAPGAEARGEAVTVSNSDTHAVLCVSSMDGEPIRSSRRLLAIHLTDVMNTGVQFGDEEHTILNAWGDLPLLVRRGTCRVQVRFDGGGELQVYVIGTNGERRRQCASRVESGTLHLDAETVSNKGTALAYEIVR